MYEDNLLTNFDKVDKPIYEKAIKEYLESGGSDILYIDDNATDLWENKLNDSFALRCKDYTADLTKFWVIQRRIRENNI